MKSFSQIQRQNLAPYNFVRDHTEIKFMHISNDDSTKVMLVYYNKIYLFHLEWADLVEKSLESSSKLSRIHKRDNFKTHCELILDSEAELIEGEKFNHEKFKPFNYGYYGTTVLV